MSKTLPAAIIAGKGGDSERVLLVRIIPESGDAWNEYDWATRDITITAWESGGDKVFSGGVLRENAFSAIQELVDISEGGNVGTISGLKIRVANPQFDSDESGDLRFDEKSNIYNFENRTVEIWLAFWTGSSPAYTDILLRYRGVIVDVKHDYATFTFTVENAEIKRHKIIPDLVLNDIDYPYLPDYNKGKVVPLLYGQLCGGDFSMGTELLVPMTLIEIGKGKYIMSRNKMTGLSAPHDGGSLYLYHQGTDHFEFLSTVPDVDHDITYGRPTIVELIGASQAELRGEYYGHGTEQGSKFTPWAFDVKKIIDRDLSTYLYIGAVNARIFVKIPIPHDVGALGLESAGNFVLRVAFAAVTAGVTGTICYYNPEWDNGVGAYSTGVAFDNSDTDTIVDYDFGLDKSAHGSMDDQSDQYHNWTPDEISSYEWGIKADITGVDYIHLKEIYVHLQNIVLRSRNYMATQATHGDAYKAKRRRGLLSRKGRQIDTFQQDNLCAWLQGTEFGNWLGVPSRSDLWEIGDLVDGCVWHIEAILRDELGLGDDDINMTSFEDISNIGGAREYWAFATIIEKQKNSLEYIAEFCQNAGIIFFTDYQHKEKVAALAKAASAVKTIDRTTIKEGSIKVSLSPLNDVFNEFEIIFGRHWVSGSYRKVKFCNSGDHSLDSNVRSGTPNTYTGLCADSQSKYNMTQKFSFVADWLSEETEYADQSDKLLKWFAEWLCYRKYIVEFETAGLDHIDLELGDQVKIDHTLLPAGISDSAYFMLFDVSHDLNRDRMKFKFIQIPDLLP